MKAKPLGISKCVCKSPHINSYFGNLCTACFGSIAAHKFSRSVTPSLITDAHHEQSLRSQLSDKAYQQSLKAMKTLRSVSSSSVKENPQHKRTSTSTRQESKIFYLSEDRSSFNHNKFSIELSQKSTSKPSMSNEFSYQSAHKIFVSHRSDRALSSRVYKVSSSPIPELRFPSLPEFRRPHQSSLLTECVHKGHTNAVSCISILQGRSFTGSFDYHIASWPRLDPLYQFQPIKPQSMTKAHSRKLYCLASIGKNLLISAGQHRLLKIWNTSRDLTLVSTINSLEKCTKALLAASYSTLISAGAEGKIKVWDVETRTMAKVYAQDSAAVNCLAQVNPSTFLSAAQDGVVRFGDIRASKSVSMFKHCEAVRALKAADFNFFLTASDKLRKWDLRKEAVVETFECGRVNAIEKVKEFLITAGKKIDVWDGGQILHSMERESEVLCMKFNEANESLYIGCRNSDVVVYNI